MSKSVAELIAEAQVANKAAIKAKIEELKLSTMLTQVQNPAYIDRQIAKEDAAKLTGLMEVFADEDFLEDCKDGTEFKLRRVFGYGSQVDTLLTMARTIQYSQADLKTKMLEATGLTEDLFEEIADALGSAPYFSEKIMNVVPAIQPDLPVLKELLTFMAQELGLALTPNMSKLNQKHIDDMYKYQLARAELEKENTLAYINDTGKGAKAPYDV